MASSTPNESGRRFGGILDLDISDSESDESIQNYECSNQRNPDGQLPPNEACQSSNATPASLSEWLRRNRFQQYERDLTNAGWYRIEDLVDISEDQLSETLEGMAVASKMPLLVRARFLALARKLNDDIHASQSKSRTQMDKAQPLEAKVSDDFAQICFETANELNRKDQNGRPLDELKHVVKEHNGELKQYAKCLRCGTTKAPALLVIDQGYKTIRKHLRTVKHKKRLQKYALNLGFDSEISGNVASRLRALRSIAENEFDIFDVFNNGTSILCVCGAVLGLMGNQTESSLRANLDSHIKGRAHQMWLEIPREKRKTRAETLDTLVARMPKRRRTDCGESDFRERPALHAVD